MSTSHIALATEWRRRGGLTESPGCGDLCTWIGQAADSELVLSWHHAFLDNRSYMQDIEYGKNVSLATIVLLADALGCEVVDLFEKRRQMGAPRKTGTQTCRTRSLVQGPRTTQVEPSFTLIG